MQPLRGSNDEKLDALFREYAKACPDRDPSANFMPNLWGRIEARQRQAFSFRRMANTLATAALALSIALGVYMAVPHASPVNLTQSYVEALAEANAVDAPEIIGPLHLEPAAEPVQ
jgi:hypothetical protein